MTLTASLSSTVDHFSIIFAWWTRDRLTRWHPYTNERKSHSFLSFSFTNGPSDLFSKPSKRDWHWVFSIRIVRWNPLSLSLSRLFLRIYPLPPILVTSLLSSHHSILTYSWCNLSLPLFKSQFSPPLNFVDESCSYLYACCHWLLKVNIDLFHSALERNRRHYTLRCSSYNFLHNTTLHYTTNTYGQWFDTSFSGTCVAPYARYYKQIWRLSTQTNHGAHS